MAVLSVTCGTALGACGASADTEADTRAVAETQQALAPGSYSYADASGEVKIQVKVCNATSAAVGLRCAYCAVDSDYLLVGGGAEIVGSPTSGRLQATRPDSAGTAIQQGCPGNSQTGDIWLARSFSNGNTPHSLQVYAIGLKLPGLSAADLQLYAQPHEDTTGFSKTPTMVVDALSGFDLIGGGAELLSGMTQPGHPDIPLPPTGYLTESRPDNPGVNNSWRAAGVLDGNTTGSLKAFAIGIKRCLPVPGWDECLRTKWHSATSASGLGYRSVTQTTPYPWASVSVGAGGVTTGGTRYLADVIPWAGTGQGFSVTTKDEGTAGNGSVTGYALGIAKFDWQPWWFNVIAFINTAGSTVFSRPAGAAPVNLQQSTESRTSNARHWHLEGMGSGQYRIRNGNPQQGSECAARLASSPGSVKVLPCGTSTDFLFTIDFGDLADSFRLRNVANGRCIDNLDSTSTSDLAFRTCPGPDGYQQSMQLSLWPNAWPQ